MCYLNANADLLAASYPTVVYCIAGPEHRTRLCELLERRYPGGHAAYILAGSGDREHEVVGVRVCELKEPLLRADLGAVLYVPPLEKGDRNACSK